MECFVVVAEYHSGDAYYDVLSNFQGPFSVHPVMCRALRIQNTKLRLRTPAISGGGFGIKVAVFPFERFPGVDVILGPEMRSTGEVMGMDKSLAVALANSFEVQGFEVERRDAQVAAGRDPPARQLEDVADQGGGGRLAVGAGDAQVAGVALGARQQLDIADDFAAVLLGQPRYRMGLGVAVGNAGRDN